MPKIHQSKKKSSKRTAPKAFGEYQAFAAKMRKEHPGIKRQEISAKWRVKHPKKSTTHASKVTKKHK